MAAPGSRPPGPDPGARGANEERELRAKLRVDPDHAETRARLAAYFESRGRPEEAAREHFRIAAAARARGDEALLASAIREVLRLDPAHPVLFTETPPRRRRKPTDDAPHLVVAHEEVALRTALVRVLESWGHKVSGAGSATELAALAAPPDLLIVGPRLPDLSGFELAQAVRETRPRVAVIMLTAAFRAEVALGTGELPASAVDEYLERPFAPALLEAKVNACLWRAAHTAPVPASLPPGEVSAPIPAAAPTPAAETPTAALPRFAAVGPPLTVPPSQGSPAGVSALIVLVGLAMMIGVDFALRAATSAPAASAEMSLLQLPPPLPPPDPAALWRKLSRSAANDVAGVEATLITPELVRARAYHTALKLGGDEDKAFAAAATALTPYDFEQLVYINLGFRDLSGLGLDADSIYAGLRLGAPGAVAVGAQYPAAVFSPRLVREAGDGAEHVRLLSFAAAFSREPLRAAHIATLEVAEPAPGVRLSLPLGALSLDEVHSR